MYVLAVIEHSRRRIRILGATAQPTSTWVGQAAKNLVMDLEDAGCRARYPVRGRDGKFPELFDVTLADAGIEIVLSGIRTPRLYSIMEWWVQTSSGTAGPGADLEPSTPVACPPRVRTVLQRTPSHQGIGNDDPLCAVPEHLADPVKMASLDVRRHDRLGSILHEYKHAA
jgi:putative transposase